MKLYDFDHIDESLKLVPLAARRALDFVGQKLTLDGFHSLSLADRTQLTEAGSGLGVDSKLALGAIEKASPPATKIESVAESDGAAPPDSVVAVYGIDRPLSAKVWASLTPLDRYVLCKVAAKNREERVEAAYHEIVGAQSISTHLRPQGGVHMVSVSEKEPTLRKAIAECFITMSEEAFRRLRNRSAAKGDVLAVARVAGIMATKKTSEVIPLCHPLSLEHAEVDFEEDPARFRLRVLCSVAVRARTGVEMEAMVGANLAALTVYDMLKSVDRGMSVGPSRLLEKTGGRSGSFSQESDQ